MNKQPNISLEEFQNLPTEEVARLVRAAGPKVCVFPINGTRRWFMLEHPPQSTKDLASAYLELMTECYARIFQLVFEHGVDTLLTPIFGPDLMERGEDYTRVAVEGLTRLTNYPLFLDFYETYEVRLHFYGDYRKFLDPTPYAYLSDLFTEATARTLKHKRHRLFVGLFAHDATENVAEIAVRFYQEHGHLPNKRQVVETYYGEFVKPVDFFIGFDRPAAFDMPLIATGSEDLYFTVAPSPYLEAHTLRTILYDHLYLRHVDESSYAELSSDDQCQMAEFYTLNRHSVLGVGRQDNSGHFWYPLPQVELPLCLSEKSGRREELFVSYSP